MAKPLDFKMIFSCFVLFVSFVVRYPAGRIPTDVNSSIVRLDTSSAVFRFKEMWLDGTLMNSLFISIFPDFPNPVFLPSGIHSLKVFFRGNSQRRERMLARGVNSNF